MDIGPQTFPCRLTALQSIPYGDPSFVSPFLFTDEAGFNRDDVISFHDSQLWVEENARSVAQQFSVTV
jgi:hypothetical protein